MGNEKLSWAYKRDYDTFWLQPGPQQSLTSADWQGAMKPEFEDTAYTGPLDMDSILCAINHFNQDDVYKLPGVFVNKDGTVDSLKKQKRYNAYCKRTNGKGMKPAGWNVRYNMAKCYVQFANSASSASSSDASKRNTPLGKWGEWEVESEFLSLGCLIRKAC